MFHANQLDVASLVIDMVAQGMYRSHRQARHSYSSNGTDSSWLLVSAVTLSQTYSNPTNSVLEAVYRFPIPESAAVNAFHVEFSDGRMVIGRVEEKQKAQQDYQQAVEVRRYAHSVRRVD